MTQEYRFDQIAIVPKDKKKPTEEDKANYVGLEHLSPHTFDVVDYGSEVAPKGEKLVMRKGDVLFGKRRAYQKKVGIAPCDGIFSAHGMVLRPNEEIVDARFFPFFIKSDCFLDEAIRISVGSLSPTVNWRDLRELRFRLPSMERQRKLADILCAGEDLKSTYRKLLCACDEQVKSRFIEMFEKYANEIALKPLEEIVVENRPVTYGIVKPGQNVEGGIPVIKVKDFPSGEILMDDLLYASPEIESRYERSRLLAGDLLFSIRGSVGRMAFVPEALEGANLTQDTARLTIRPEYDPVYIRSALALPQVKEWIAKHIRGVAMQGINLADLRKLVVPVLSRTRQHELSCFVQQVDKSEFALKRAIDGVSATMSAILNQELGMSDVQ